MIMKKVLIVVLVVTVVVLAGFLGYQKINLNQPQTNQSNSNKSNIQSLANHLATTTSSEIPGWDTFINDKYGYEVSYPKSWYIKDTYTIADGEGVVVSTNKLQVTLISGDGHYVITIQPAGNFDWTLIKGNTPLFINDKGIILNYSSFGSLINFFQSEAVKNFLEKDTVYERSYQAVNWYLQQKDVEVVKETLDNRQSKYKMANPEERFFLINSKNKLYDVVFYEHYGMGSANQEIIDKVFSTFKFIK